MRQGSVFLDSFAPKSLLTAADTLRAQAVAGVGKDWKAASSVAFLRAPSGPSWQTEPNAIPYRLQRLLLHLLFNITGEDASDFSPQREPCYLRLLGFTPRGRQLLKCIKKRATLPLVTKPARDLVPHIQTSQRTARMWELECLATDLYVLAYPCPRARQAGQDYTQPLVITTGDG